MSQRILDFQDVDAGYGGVAVVRNLTLFVDAGEVVALIGPNGAGKTTTLMTVSGFAEVLRGTVRVLGRPLPKLRRAHLIGRWGVHHVPEQRGIFYGLTVEENLRLATRHGRVDLDRAASYFPVLESLMSRRAGLLSGGEQQMLALGRALLSEPRLLMVDEMSLGLAPIICEELLPIVRRMADETGAGVLIVEQHADLALEQADRAYLLSHGDLVFDGPASTLRDDRGFLDATYLGLGGGEESAP